MKRPRRKVLYEGEVRTVKDFMTRAKAAKWTTPITVHDGAHFRAIEKVEVFEDIIILHLHTKEGA